MKYFASKSSKIVFNLNNYENTNFGLLIIDLILNVHTAVDSMSTILVSLENSLSNIWFSVIATCFSEKNLTSIEMHLPLTKYAEYLKTSCHLPENSLMFSSENGWTKGQPPNRATWPFVCRKSDTENNASNVNCFIVTTEWKLLLKILTIAQFNKFVSL